MNAAVASASSSAAAAKRAGIGAVEGRHQRSLAAADQIEARGRDRGRASTSRPDRTPRPRCTRLARSGSRVPSNVGPTHAATARIGVHERMRGAVVDHVGLRAELRDARRHRFELGAADERSHPDLLVARVPDRHAGELRGDRLGGRSGTARSGTSTRRIAVHFWPDLIVISRTTSRTSRPKASESAPSSGSSSAQFRLSASTFTRTERWAIARWLRICAAVAPDPVNETTSNGWS